MPFLRITVKTGLLLPQVIRIHWRNGLSITKAKNFIYMLAKILFLLKQMFEYVSETVLSVLTNQKK